MWWWVSLIIERERAKEEEGEERRTGRERKTRNETAETENQRKESIKDTDR